MNGENKVDILIPEIAVVLGIVVILVIGVIIKEAEESDYESFSYHYDENEDNSDNE